MGLRKSAFLLLILATVNLPSLAFFDGSVSKSHFYDTESTIMQEIQPEKEFSGKEFWTKNVFAFGKYRPIFMLSNKELYNLMPRENVSVSQRIYTPSVYNISLKSNSIHKVSLSAPIVQKSVAVKKVEQKNQNPNELVIKKMTELYEQAKNPEAETDLKLDTALKIMNSRISSSGSMVFDLLNEVIAKEPYNAYAYYLRGEMFAQKNDFESAVKSYAEALKINPTSKQSCLGLAKILEPKNKVLAQKYYDKAKTE